MTKYHAVEGLDEAVARTKKLLFPFKLGLWLKLALVVMLIGAGGGGGGGGGGGSDSSGGDSFNSDSSESYGSMITPFQAAAGPFGSPSDAGGDIAANMTFLVAIIAAVVLLALVLIYLSSISQFVFVKALATGDLKLIKFYVSQAENGLKLFSLDVIFLVFIIAAVVAAIFGGIALVGGLSSTFLKIFLGIIGIFAFVAGLIVFIALMWLVTELVVPLMYATGCGLFAGFGRVKALAKADHWQFAVYLVLRIGLGMCGWFVQFVVRLVFYIPIFMLLFLLGVGAGAAGAPDGLVAVAVLALVPVMIAIEYVATVITLPVSVFLRYVSLVYLQRSDPSVDMFKQDEDERKPTHAPVEDRVKVF
ncbi:MAG: hypothetical protein V1875_00765 [Candidatus Altiarchaeota archaeon]